MKYQQFDLPLSLLKISLFCVSSKNEITLKNNRNNLKNISLPKTQLKQMKYQHLHFLAGPKYHHRRRKSSQGPPPASPDTPREPSVFSIPFGASPRTSWDLLRTPQGTPRDAKRTPKGPPRAPRDYERTPKDPQGISKDLPQPLRTTKQAQRSLVNL